MKKLIFGILVGVSFTALISAGVAEYAVSKKTAEVNQESGLYIYTDCKPVKEYEYLGTVKVITFQGIYKEAIPLLIKKAKKEYPSAEGIIYIDSEKADVIKFK